MTSDRTSRSRFFFVNTIEVSSHHDLYLLRAQVIQFLSTALSKAQAKKSDFIRPRDSSEAPEWCKKIITLEIPLRDRPVFIAFPMLAYGTGQQPGARGGSRYSSAPCLRRVRRKAAISAVCLGSLRVPERCCSLRGPKSVHDRKHRSANCY